MMMVSGFQTVDVAYSGTLGPGQMPILEIVDGTAFGLKLEVIRNAIAVVMMVR